MAAPPRAADYYFVWGPSPSPPTIASPRLRLSPGLSPPLIAMVAVVGAAFLIVLYAHLLRRFRRWRRRRRLLRSTASSPPHFNPLSFSDDGDGDYFLSPFGLDDSAIGTLPLSLFSSPRRSSRDCAVCLLEFEPGISLRTLPLCSHSFHVACIDVWLKSHATCPLCRAAVFRLDSPFVPMRAARIRPSIDDDLLLLDPELSLGPPRRDFLLKRSYSFAFERSAAAERMAMEASSTASPWRYRQRSFWSKRWPSPFAGGSASASRAARVFSFRSYRSGVSAAKSPFMRRRDFFFPLSSEPRASRRSRSMASPSAVFVRGAASSSRMRCGDPEALLSPERLNRR